jgi:hypothetical protein
MSNTIRIVVKPTVGGMPHAERFTVTIASDATVHDLKVKTSESCSLKVKEQILIYKGKILKNEERVSEYGVIGRGAHE